MARNRGADPDPESSWPRQLLIAGGALVVVALVIGGVVSLVALGAARVTGLDTTSSRPTQKASLYIPSGSPTVGLSGSPAASGSPSAGDSSSPSASSGASQQAKQKKRAKQKKQDKQTKAKKHKKKSAKKTPKKATGGVTLQVSPHTVSPNQRINMSGRYPGGDGTRLQVQRREGGSWTSFPVTVPVRSGEFHTYILTGRSGAQRFRVADLSTGRHSPAVRVTVR